MSCTFAPESMFKVFILDMRIPSDAGMPCLEQSQQHRLSGWHWDLSFAAGWLGDALRVLLVPGIPGGNTAESVRERCGNGAGAAAG